MLALALAPFALTETSWGQMVEVGRPRTLVVGKPSPGSRTGRVDGARSGCSPTGLPTSGLRTEWRIPLGTLVEHAPLVDIHGRIYVVGTRGEVIAVARDGTERWRVSTGAAQPGPPSLLADDTVVFVDAAGQAVAVRAGAVRWRVRFGRGDAARPAPLPLDDGGVVVATSRELAALDVDGRERARALLPEPSTVPLVALRGRVIAISVGGVVWSWSPGAEPERIASFGSPVDGGAALVDDHTLVAVTAAQLHVTAVDLVRGTVTTRAVATPGLWLGPPASRRGSVHVGLLTSMGEFAVGIDATGNEIARTLLSAHPLPPSTDGGPAALIAVLHTAPLVDDAGAFAFATLGGAIGVAARDGAELLSQEICEPPVGTASRLAPAVVGLAPLEPGAFVAACHAGALLAIHGAMPDGDAKAAGGGAFRDAP